MYLNGLLQWFRNYKRGRWVEEGEEEEEEEKGEEENGEMEEDEEDEEDEVQQKFLPPVLNLTSKHLSLIYKPGEFVSKHNCMPYNSFLQLATDIYNVK